jgi:hypothetical protein
MFPCARRPAWSKENCLNIGISRLPHDAKYIGTFDSDIHFRKPGWAAEAIHILQFYPVVQPWKTAYDLGPNDDHLDAHVSFASVFHAGKPVVPKGTKFWTANGGPYDYPHSGFAWCWVREILDKIGGLFELGGMGSGDHHMALGIAGLADYSIPAETSSAYRDAVKLWEARALVHVNRKLGYVRWSSRSKSSRRITRRLPTKIDLICPAAINRRIRFLLKGA